MTITIEGGARNKEIRLMDAASGQCFRVGTGPQIYMRSDEYDPALDDMVICITIPEGELSRWSADTRIILCYFAMEES